MLMNALKPYWIQILLAALLIADLSYSTIQHHHKAIDGDLVAISLPAPHYAEVLQDPIGLKAITEDKEYSGAGRFWAHYTEYKYFQTMPLVLQKWMDPISSIYVAPALLKILVQIVLTLLLAGIVSGTEKFWRKDFLISAMIISPFFIAGGIYYDNFAVIDAAVTYAIAYALMVAVLLMYYYPFFKSAIHGQPLKFSWLQTVFLVLIACTVPFSGPLVQPVVFLISIIVPLIYFYQFRKHAPKLSVKAYIKSIPLNVVVYLGVITVVCAYSYFVGTFNSENINNSTVSLIDRYVLLTKGIFNILAPTTGYPVILLFVGINWYLLSKHKEHPQAKILLIAFAAIALFSLLYLTLLPMGGYRAYRPLIVRRDTLIPINIGLMFIYASSALFLLEHYAGKARTIFIITVVLFCGHLLVVDQMSDAHYRCERWLIEQIANADRSPVKIKSDCPVLSWSDLNDPAQSAYNAQMLEIWNVTEDVTLYYQE